MKRVMEFKKWQIQAISDEEYLLGENPLWHLKKKELWWTDVYNKTIYSFDPRTNRVSVRAKGKSVSSFAFTKNGALVCGCLEGLFLWSDKLGFEKITDNYEGKFLQINDGIADAKGRFLFGTNYYDAGDKDYMTGKLYKLDNNGDISVLDENIHLSNGLGFSPDNSILYYADSVSRTIYSYQYNLETGTVSNKYIFIKVPETEGIPDGLTVDAEGFVWSAQWYGGCIVRYTPAGKVDLKIWLPDKQVTSLAFGGDELSEIYVTTAASNWESPVAPKGYNFDTGNIGGKIYLCKTRIIGKPEYYAQLNIKTILKQRQEG